MGTPNDDARTQAVKIYEAYVAQGITKIPKMPRGYDAELASLKATYEAFCRGSHRYRGYIPLGTLSVLELSLDWTNAKRKLSRAGNTRTAEVMTKNFCLRLQGEKGYTPLDLLLSDGGEWIAIVGRFPHRVIHVVYDVDELMELLTVTLREFGEFQHNSGQTVDAARINWHLTALLVKSHEVRSAELATTKEQLVNLAASRERMGLKPLC